MATGVPPKKNVALVIYVALTSQSDSNILQVNPTLATGDVKVSIDGAALADMTTLPVVTPASSKWVKVSLSADEMNGDNIQVQFSDAAGAEWADLAIEIQTAARWINDLAFPTTTGRGIDVTTGGGVGIDWANVENPTTSLNLSGTSTLALEPTTAGRKLDVTTTGGAGIDWANVEAPTTTLNLSGTTIKTATDVEADSTDILANTIDIQSRLPATLISGNMASDVQVIANAAITGATLDDTAITEIQSGLATDTDITSILSAIAALNNLSQAQVAALLTATIADSVPANGTRPSIATGVLMLTRFLMQAAVAGTVVTVNKEDGTTPVMTFTTNSATAPTSITRAT